MQTEKRAGIPEGVEANTSRSRSLLSSVCPFLSIDIQEMFLTGSETLNKVNGATLEDVPGSVSEEQNDDERGEKSPCLNQ